MEATEFLRVVESWDEGARADFVFEVTHRGWMADIGESFTMNDPSVKVRNQAIQELSWISAVDALTRVVNALNDADFDTILPAFFPEAIPEALCPRFVAANRRLLSGETTPLARKPDTKLWKAGSKKTRSDHRPERPPSDVAEPSRCSWPKPDTIPQNASGRGAGASIIARMPLDFMECDQARLT
jgi:hypothetical protein